YITAVNEAGRESEPSLEVTATPSSSSLLPPVITQPTNSLNPATVTRSPVAVGGKAPKDAEVEVFVNGELAGTTLTTEIPNFKIEAENSKNKMVNCILSADGEGIALSSRRTDVALGKTTWSENWWNKWVDLGQVYTIYEISVVGYIRFPRGWTDYYFTPITDVPMYTEEADWENATLSSIGEHTMSTECLVINYDGLSHHRAPFRTTYRLKEPICARHIYLSVATWGSPYIQQIEAVGNLKDSIGCVISPWIETGQGRIYEELETQQTLNGGNITYQYTTWREGERRIDLGLLYEEDPSRLTASSQDGAASLFDGKFGTNWYNPNDKTTNFWQFDLGSQRKISRIRIAGGKGSKYSILGSLDGEIWDRIAPEAEDYGIFRMLMDKGYFEEHIFILPKLIRYIKITQPDAKSLIGLELFEADWRNVLPEVTPEGGMRIRAVLERQDHQDTSPMLDSFTLLGETAFNLEGVSLKSGINTIWARSMVGQEASPLSLPIEVILDQAIAVAKITSPSDGEGVKGTVEVIGSVSSTSLEEWRLEYRLRDSFSWTRIAQSSTRATNDYLANWQTQDLADGDYELRLVVRNTDAIEKEHIIELRIENYLDISDLLVSPGPFSPGESPGEKDEVTISYHLSAPARIELKITNQDGRRVKTFGPALKDEGLNHEIWDPAGFESGTYRVIVSSSEPYVYHDLAWSKEKG
ncbi:discoidin domain-containing protein, partial [bacterium]|nr:discoidin domain-containing protein [bacterium]